MLVENTNSGLVFLWLHLSLRVEVWDADWYQAPLVILMVSGDGDPPVGHPSWKAVFQATEPSDGKPPE